MALTETPRRARPQRRDAIENRQAILDAASVVLNHDADAPLEAIAQHAGLSRRTLYGHFANRDELLEALLIRGAARITATLDPTGHPDARIEIALFGARMWAEVDNVRVLALLAVRGPHRDQVARTLEPLRRHLRFTVERGIAAGALRDDIEASSLARLIESVALQVLEEATRTFMSSERGHRLVMLTALGIAGLSWTEATELIDSVPQLQHPVVPAR